MGRADGIISGPDKAQLANAQILSGRYGKGAAPGIFGVASPLRTLRPSRGSPIFMMPGVDAVSLAEPLLGPLGRA